AVDIAYEVPHLIPDQKSHATSTRYDPGGNGINVARALKELLVYAHSCCVVAGNIGELLQKLLQHHLDDPHCVHVEGETRVNATILQGDPATQFEITGIGPRVSEPILAEVRETFLGLCKDGFAVLTGSVPPGVDDHFYGDMVDRVRAGGGQSIVDAHGALLQHALPHHPFLIKPIAMSCPSCVGASSPRWRMWRRRRAPYSGKGCSMSVYPWGRRSTAGRARWQLFCQGTP
ncbi:carbohydrate kinase, PfkB family protein, partial [Acidithiobacillus sp. GGI-221]